MAVKGSNPELINCVIQIEVLEKKSVNQRLPLLFLEFLCHASCTFSSGCALHITQSIHFFWTVPSKYFFFSKP